uniref:chondroadherin-like protein n=1 Tax=Ciona intestinalis TaxID=7719 RepID=UPI00089DB5EB|nr:chondroadherin-like protein [Ciona intestinalis]|eukprot:XP_009861947.2 chondroadherin-like protein [Ciona intestinalis]
MIAYSRAVLAFLLLLRCGLCNKYLPRPPSYSLYDYVAEYEATTIADYGSMECNHITFCPGESGWEAGAGDDCQKHVDCIALSNITSAIPSDSFGILIRGSTFKTLRPKDMLNMTKLRYLHIEYNDITTMEPNCFAAQGKLKSLRIEGNMIANVSPNTFTGLGRVTEISLSNNGIRELHRGSFSGLPIAKTLDLAFNMVHTLKDNQFLGLDNLKQLNLMKNNISTISPLGFAGLTKLQVLNLKLNKIHQFPSTQLKVLPALDTLLLGINPITEIRREALRGMKLLRQLWLEGCNISSIARRAFNNKALQTLVLERNELENFPNLGRMRNLEILNLDDNPWKCDCDAVSMLKWISRHELTELYVECETPRYRHGVNMLTYTEEGLCDTIPVYDSGKTENITMPVIKLRHPILLRPNQIPLKRSGEKNTDSDKEMENYNDGSFVHFGNGNSHDISGDFSGEIGLNLPTVNRSVSTVHEVPKNPGQADLSVIVVIVVTLVIAMIVVTVVIVWKVSSRHERNTRPRFRRQGPIVRPANDTNGKNGENEYRLQRQNRRQNDYSKYQAAAAVSDEPAQTSLGDDVKSGDVTPDDVINQNGAEVEHYCDVHSTSDEKQT